MDSLPSELVVNVVGYLNPADRWRLSATSRRYRRFLPVWLRIRILSPTSRSSLRASFYVSPATTPDQPLYFYPTSKEDEEGAKIMMEGTPKTGETVARTTRDNHKSNRLQLLYGADYLFWTYDYDRENPVYLGRHGQKLLYHEDPHFLYTLGLRPKKPNQTWTVVPQKGTSLNPSQAEGAETETEEEDRGDIDATSTAEGGNVSAAAAAAASAASSTLTGEPVPFASAICLTVGGQDPKPFRPDSSKRLYLSAHTLSMGALWYAIHEKEWCIDEELQILRSADYHQVTTTATGSNNNALTSTNNSKGVVVPREEDIATTTEEEGAKKNKSNTGAISEREVVIHAIPEILDGGYSLYSPDSLKYGEASCAMHHATIPCHYWIDDGHLMFHAFESLPFKFRVPILEEDYVQHHKNGGAGSDGSRSHHHHHQVEPLSILLQKNSSRWWAIKHYMSTAADVEEGRAFQMESFLRNSKDHEDHTIVYDEETEIVQITVKDAVIDEGFPNVPFEDNEAVWKFLLCG